MTAAAPQKQIKRWKVALKRIALSVATILAIAFAVVGFLSTRNIYQPYPFDQKRFDQIVADIQTGKLKANGSIVALPPDLAGASVTDRAYVTSDKVFIPTWVGRMYALPYGTEPPNDDYVEGYVYSAKAKEAGSSELSPLNAPGFSTPWNAEKDTRTQDLNFSIDHKVSANWYKAAAITNVSS